MLKRLLVHIPGMIHDTHVYPDLMFKKKEQLTLMVFQNQDTTSWYCARVYFLAYLKVQLCVCIYFEGVVRQS